MWTRERQRRYAHHVLLPDVGGRGQDRLTAAAVAVAVDGRAGQLAALYLAAAGVGTVVLRGGLAPCPGDGWLAPAPTVASAVAAAIAARNPEVVVAVDDRAAPEVALPGDRPDLDAAAALALAGAAAAHWAWTTATAEAR
jgi:hypothetical protein